MIIAILVIMIIIILVALIITLILRIGNTATMSMAYFEATGCIVYYSMPLHIVTLGSLI